MDFNTEMDKLSIRNRPSRKMPKKEIPRGKMHVIKRSKLLLQHDERSVAHAAIYAANNVDACYDVST